MSLAPNQGNTRVALPKLVPLIELVERAKSGVDELHFTMEVQNSALKLYNGMQAYRRYNWLFNKPQLNVSGNFRGMVVSSKAKAAYLVNIENAGKLDRYGQYLAFAAAAVEFAKNVQGSQFTSDPLINFQMLTSDAESAVARALAGVVTGPTRMVTSGLMGVCGELGVSNKYIGLADGAAARLQTSVDAVTAPAAITGYNNAIAYRIIMTIIPPD